MSTGLLVRAALEQDIAAIHALLNIYAEKRVVLARSEEDIRYYLNNFTVAVDGDGKLLGCVAVRDFGNDLLEVRSLVVQPDSQRGGIGRAMVEHVAAKLKAERAEFRLFALTLTPDFFQRLGFQMVPRALFPEKIWSDCAKCPKKDHCDETAVLLSFP